MNDIDPNETEEIDLNEPEPVPEPPAKQDKKIPNFYDIDKPPKPFIKTDYDDD